MKGAITIVDDCDELRDLLAILLDDAFGATCLSLSSLAEVELQATDVLRSRAVILDINLGPRRPDGVAVFHWLRRHDYAGKIFFFTGHAKDSPYVTEAARTGVPILEKPMEMEEFLPVLHSSIPIEWRVNHENF